MGYLSISDGMSVRPEDLWSYAEKSGVKAATNASATAFSISSTEGAGVGVGEGAAVGVGAGLYSGAL